MHLSIIAAKAENGVIGKDNQLIWHLPADLKHFKELTTGGTLVMGRKTHESIGRPLPNRRNVVVTRQSGYRSPGCEVVSSVEEALRLCTPDDRVFIIGGAEIYRQTIHLAQTLYITLVHEKFGGDAVFPDIDPSVWEETSREDHAADEKNAYDYSFVVYQRKAGDR